MSKAILVIDMPKCCDECNLHYERDCADYCSIGNEYIDINVSKRKPDWCPLKEVPEKKEREIVQETYNGGYSHGIVYGWNACIDKILKGSE